MCRSFQNWPKAISRYRKYDNSYFKNVFTLVLFCIHQNALVLAVFHMLWNGLTSW